MENNTEIIFEFFHNVTIDIENPKRDSTPEKYKEVLRLSRIIRIDLEKVFFTKLY